MAIGVGFGAFLQKKWQVARSFGNDVKAKIDSAEFGFLVEGGGRYHVGKRLQIGAGYRHTATQHGLAIETSNGTIVTTWYTKRTMPELDMGWRF